MKGITPQFVAFDETNETEQEVEEHQNVPTDANGNPVDYQERKEAARREVLENEAWIDAEYESLNREQRKEVDRIETRMEKLQRETRETTAYQKQVRAKKAAKRKRARASRKLNRRR